MALRFKRDGEETRFIKVENSPKVDEEAQTNAVLRAFRDTSNNNPDDPGPGELCFRFEVKNPSKKNTSKKKTVIFLGIMDNKPFEAALRTCSKLVGGDVDSSVFMTDDGFGIVAKQIAGNVFFKYGVHLHLHVGISLRNVSWHTRR